MIGPKCSNYPPCRKLSSRKYHPFCTQRCAAQWAIEHLTGGSYPTDFDSDRRRYRAWSRLAKTDEWVKW